MKELNGGGQHAQSFLNDWLLQEDYTRERKVLKLGDPLISFSNCADGDNGDLDHGAVNGSNKLST